MRTNKKTISSFKAFTLLELIIAIALMDVIAVALYSSIYTAFKAKNKSQAAVRPFQYVTPVFEYIRKDLVSAMNPDGILAGVFLGENNPGQGDLGADILSFYTSSYQPKANEVASNIVNIEYVLENDLENDKIVLKRLVTKNILTPSAPEADEEIICRDIIGLDIQYYDGNSWLQEWDSSVENSQLPWAVRITLTVIDNSDSRSSEDTLRHFTRIFMLPSALQEVSGQDEGETRSEI